MWHGTTTISVHLTAYLALPCGVCRPCALLQPAVSMEPAQLPVAFRAAAEVVRSHVDYHAYTSLPYTERCATNAYWRLPTYAAPPISSPRLIVQAPHTPGVQLLTERLLGCKDVLTIAGQETYITLLYLNFQRDNRRKANLQQSQGIKEDLLRRLQRP